MVICYVNPDGSHVRGCDPHKGEHPYDWCRADALRVQKRRGRICAHCGRQFWAQRRDTQYCEKKCRELAGYHRRKAA